MVDLWAPWCGPCHMFRPIFEEVAATAFGIDGSEVDRLVGVPSRAHFDAFVSDLAASAGSDG